LDNSLEGMYEDAKGNKTWWKNSELHREVGPAVILGNGYKEWRYSG
jgi:hypothetical protein